MNTWTDPYHNISSEVGAGTVTQSSHATATSSSSSSSSSSPTTIGDDDGDDGNRSDQQQQTAAATHPEKQGQSALIEKSNLAAVEALLAKADAASIKKGRGVTHPIRHMFGELSLLHGTPRGATVVCCDHNEEGTCVCVCVHDDRRTCALCACTCPCACMCTCTFW